MSIVLILRYFRFFLWLFLVVSFQKNTRNVFCLEIEFAKSNFFFIRETFFFDAHAKDTL
ncbi:hypothetical protein KP509_02G016200 [Ceratopteris richardii]|uniref:Uncharacterized protein n=1 Tax=Ceratopteris richardii TaxID=49495 RepID=A0A8T2VBM8_CERRI|nr:hypothetical protein KP509_02G016200 [Ceratopteris richardii]